MTSSSRPRFVSRRIQNIRDSRKIYLTESQVIVTTVLYIFAPAPLTGRARRPHKPYGWAKIYNYVKHQRRQWFKVSRFCKMN